MKQAKPEDAAKFLERAVVVEPGSAGNFLGLCKLASSRGKNDEALAYCEKAVAADPENAQAHYRLAQICRTLGKHEEADRQLAIFQSVSARNRSESLYMTGVQIGAAPSN
jgi:tetratricopeptide (TPR) repeat protein